MKKIILPLALTCFCISAQAQYQRHEVVTRGNAFSPTSLNIMPLDTVVFTLGSFHDLLEVSESTWNANGETALPNGISMAKGAIREVVFSNPGTFYYVCTPHVSEHGMKGKVVIADFPTSFSTNSAHAKGIRIYPNPAQSHVTVQFPEPMQVGTISVVNAQGSEVLSTSVQSVINSHALQVDQLEKGIYQVLISAPDKRFVGKIVKQ